MASGVSSQCLRGLSQETNNAWSHFISLFRIDCINEGAQRSHDLLPARLEVVNEQLFAISHAPGGAEEQITVLISHPHADVSQDVAVVGSFHQVGLNSSKRHSEMEPFIKFESSDQIQLPLRDFGTDLADDLTYDDAGWADRGEESLAGSDGNMTRKRPRVSSSGLVSDATCTKEPRCTARRTRVVRRKKISIDSEQSLSPTTQSLIDRGQKPKSIVKDKLSTDEIVQHWKQFELKETAKISNLATGSRIAHFLEHPLTCFQDLLTQKHGTDTSIQQRKLSADEAHAIVTFITAVASPEALVQFKQAMIGWRTRSLTMELMQANGFVPVLQALNHLEAQNAFTAIATRIKLVQLAEAVDVANLKLPAPKGRGNPVVIWLSNQYRLFLRAEFPDLKEGSSPWNTKLDDIKRKVKAGRRWQQLIKLFGVGIIGLVPSLVLGDSRNQDFNKSIKTYPDPCFKLIVETLELKKGNHVRQLSTKLQEFMQSLFEGNTDLPRLVLEYMDVSQIEAQPNCSPDLVMYLDVATSVLNLPPIDLTMEVDYIDYDNSSSGNSLQSSLARFGLSEDNLEEFKGNNKMSGTVVNSFMRILKGESDTKQDGSLFMDSDFFPGANRCLNCRSQDHFCDMTEQQGAHCTRCRCDGMICERPRRNPRLGINNFYSYTRIFIPIFTKEITHWSLVVISPVEKTVVHYDSLAYPGPEIPAILTWALREVVKWVKDLIVHNWESEEWRDSSYSVAKQPPGGNDCGICTVMFCRLLQTGQPFPPDGSLTPNFMAKMRAAYAKALLEQNFSDDVLDLHVTFESTIV
ncbi:hypothetical protein BP6252_11907 [Coleophoma cylindrospora]|uniref:Ubiquitin-like protease family profile domain-containing protein n=1 Tax=Coleophoma cylindrospora TaxID=1849047 RepID=A0A3D8QLY4_9HELO|nr:hypothetical protein BP6252_11907 [Coleophoma cylindrospora]